MRLQLEDNCRRYQIDALYAFGSLAEQVTTAVRTGTHLERSGPSDLDIGVLPRAGHRLDARQRVTLVRAVRPSTGSGRTDTSP